jgi:peptide-methionine (S)-S-oxide reductase
MKIGFSLLALFLLPASYLAAADPAPTDQVPAGKLALDPDAKEFPEGTKVATFGSGCFWCSEEFFHQLPGVLSVVSGYMGGEAATANYKEVSAGRTGHAEVAQVHYDPTVVTFEQLLDRFFASHDPTTLNAQGADRGTQYRSAIFYHDPSQQSAAKSKIKELTELKRFSDVIVTEVSEAEEFYVAEDYHQNFARKNPNHGYLESVLYPKMEKLNLKIP